MDRNQFSKGVKRPGTTDLHRFEVNGHSFAIRERSIGDFVSMRTYAMNMLVGRGAAPTIAAAMVDAGGFEFDVARVAVLLVEAPDHWKRTDPETGLSFIDPTVLDFDAGGLEEFQEVQKEVTSFLNRFRKGRIQQMAAAVQNGGGSSALEGAQNDPLPHPMGIGQ